MSKIVELMQQEMQAAGGAVTPYSTRSWGELIGMELPALVNVWGWFMLGTLAVIFGQGGLGKSRLALNVARNQVLGLPFAGLPTHEEPLRHLFMGSENSIHRLQNDARKMSQGLTVEEIALLDSHIRMATLEGPEDNHISLASPANIERWEATLSAYTPEVLWVDPWGDVLDGEANSDEDTRATLATLRRLLRRQNPNALTVVLAHARTGARNIAQAFGFDAANFGKGSKALYSAARCVWNLAPGDETESPSLVCVHGKSNDSPREKAFCIRLDPATMLYERAPDFDLETWISEVNDRANGKIKGRRRPQLTEDAAIEALGDHTLTALEVRTLLRDKGATRDEADALLTSLVQAGRWERWRPPLKTAHVYFGPSTAMARRRELFA